MILVLNQLKNKMPTKCIVLDVLVGTYLYIFNFSNDQ